MAEKRGVLYSIWSIIRLSIIVILMMGIVNIIPFAVTGKFHSELLNYSIALSMLFGVIINVKWIEKKPLKQAGLSIWPKDIAYFVGGVLQAILAWGLFLGAVSIIRMDNLFPVAIEAVIHPQRSLIAFVVIPFVEEVFHRGYFMGNTFQQISYWPRSVLSAFLFSVSHWANSGYSSAFMFIFAMAITTFLFGLFFNNLRKLTGSIWMGFAFHWFFNFTFACTFLDTENYDIAVVLVFVFLVAATVLTSKWIQKLRCWRQPNDGAM